MRRKLAILGVFVVAITVLVACSENIAGRPEMQIPEDGPTSNGDPSSSKESPTVSIPPRPRDLPLDGLDPCTLFTDAQIAQLTVDDIRSGEAEEGHYKGTKDCHMDVDKEPFYGYSAAAVTFEGIEEWLTPGRNIDPAKLISISGYPAAQFWLAGSNDECSIAVGVADGQQLLINVRPLDDSFSRDQLCQMSEQVAGMAMATLQTLK